MPASRASIRRTGRNRGSSSKYRNPCSDLDPVSTRVADRIPPSPRIQYRFPENCAATEPGRIRSRLISREWRFAAGARNSEHRRDRADTRMHPARTGAQMRARLIPPENMAVSSFPRIRIEMTMRTASIVPTGEIITNTFGMMDR
jgi:hypothetical protein